MSATVGSAQFETAVSWVINWEGGYTKNPGDPGNWTGGAIGSGTLLGTNMGISAAAYPTLDIPNLTLEQTEAIYLADYWRPIQGDQLPLALAMIVFDGAVNSGVGQSSEWLQTVLGVTEDGVIGPETLGAVDAWSSPLAQLCEEVLAERVVANGCDPNFPTFGFGWSRRTCALAFQAANLL